MHAIQFIINVDLSDLLIIGSNGNILLRHFHMVIIDGGYCTYTALHLCLLMLIDYMMHCMD
jgi:hypothetical protein